ncbi:Regulatory protein ArsR [Bibersteinia trehalosi USDA-ARS-USMARC-188]|uniref:Regulatory protein ArsR n=1 Tax=Bibersteinia trehalosi USDA-ARS-USMARC-188 TaxID=1263829 RepID=A0A4V7IC13_BIBTR|nr:metalloregulator ArsR/SmtB family transcription factor [Bibersteinia trehalosi]AHG82630.1 Regulatory protein ArsR [Bibersteinia trehalosi USDA-ARS-USMARC-188]TCT14199.1 ArsR family transcriptional regulator [Bibersteinia trehalosi]
MELIEIFKTLGNEYRWQMLLWLKEPEKYFEPEHIKADDSEFAGGVCVGRLTEKAGLAQSVVSNYLNALRDAGLVESLRVGKWTYYRYNPQAATQFLQLLNQQL